MTKEDAINELRKLEYYDRPFDNSKEQTDKATRKAQALAMAIKALKQLSKVEDITHKWLQNNERYAEDRMWDIKAIVIDNGEYR